MAVLCVVALTALVHREIFRMCREVFLGLHMRVARNGLHKPTAASHRAARCSPTGHRGTRGEDRGAKGQVRAERDFQLSGTETVFTSGMNSPSGPGRYQRTPTTSLQKLRHAARIVPCARPSVGLNFAESSPFGTGASTPSRNRRPFFTVIRQPSCFNASW